MNRFRCVRLDKPALFAALATVGGAASAATGPDFSTLTGGVVFTGVVTAILAVALAKVLPLVASWGGRKVLGMIGR